MAARSWRKIERRTDEIQLLEALRTSRQKRERQGRFIVEGVRNIDAALRQGWDVQAVLSPDGAPRSTWARGVVDRVDERIALSPELFDLLTDRVDRPEILLVCAMPARTLDDVPSGDVAVLVADRIASPGNLGTIVRTADALGAAAVLTVGHAASAYDPRCVRATTGSLFAVPVVPVDGPGELAPWFAARGMAVVATDEDGEVDLRDAALVRPCALLLGHEATGLSRALRELATMSVRIPIGGSASSLNVAVAAGIVLWETR